MANTITSLLRDAYSAIEIVSREQVDIIQAVTRNTTAEAASKGTTVRNPVAPKNSKYTITPSMTPLAAADMIYTNRTISLDTLEGYKFHFASEEEMGLQASGPWGTMWQQNIAQGYRTLTAAVSTALNALYYNSSRGFGTAATTPFGSDLSALGAAKVMLDVNGAPKGDRHCVIDDNATYNLLKLTQLTNVNQAGNEDALRRGVIRDLFGFQIRSDSNVALHTAGTSTGQQADSVDAIGATTVSYDGGDGGTLLVGDALAIASDASDPAGGDSKYILQTAVTAAAGNMVIASPGLLNATVDNDEITRSASYRANLAFSRDALVLAARAPKGGDAAVQEMSVADPVTGLTFRLAKYAGHHLSNWEMSILYGVGLGNPEHMVILLG